MTHSDESPTVFLTNLGLKLKTLEGEDTELSEIIVEHILSASPAEDCVEHAMTAIRVLAESRIAPSAGQEDG